jgi:hypothetical protein
MMNSAPILKYSQKFVQKFVFGISGALFRKKLIIIPIVKYKTSHTAIKVRNTAPPVTDSTFGCGEGDCVCDREGDCEAV